MGKSYPFGIATIVFLIRLTDYLSFSLLNRQLNSCINTRLFTTSEIDDENVVWTERDQSWIQDSNKIEYLIGEGITFESLGSLGINVSLEISSRNIIPHHLVSGNDLFCNRELNMKQIEAIGFDMDWTLAQYNVEFDLLAYNGARDKLVANLNYPKEVLELEYKPNLYRRGCVVDKKRGNILKLDRHKYVRRAEHGMTPMSSTERKNLYREAFQELQTFGGSNLNCMDTPFSLVDCCMFAQLVDLKDKYPSKFLMSYDRLWDDMRRYIPSFLLLPR